MAASDHEDNELIDRFLGGDEQAFNLLVRRHQDFVYNVSRKITGNHDDANESAQRVFVKLYERLSSFGKSSAFTTWLYRIATNESLNVVRSRKLKRWFGIEDTEKELPASGDTPYESLLEDEKREQLDRVLGTLPDRQRTVFVLRMSEGLSYQEISDILGVSTGSLKASFFHAVKKITSALGKIYEEE
jgi:RNA polymerase sigma-70 factor, ECF subfamily